MGRMGGTRLPPEAFRYSGLGCMMAAGILLFAAGGWVLDRVFGILPVFTLIGALLGVGLTSLSVWQRLKPGNKQKSGQFRTRDR